MDEDTPYKVFILDGSESCSGSSPDYDPDGDDLTVKEVTRTADNGVCTLNNDQTITYTPDQDYNGLDSCDYEICDRPTGGLCDEATGKKDQRGLFSVINLFVIRIFSAISLLTHLFPALKILLHFSVYMTIVPAGPNDPAVAFPDCFTTKVNTPARVSVLDGSIGVDGLADYDPDGDNLYISMVTTRPSSNGPFHGDAVIEIDQDITYTPDKDFVGEDLFKYEVCDGKSGCDIANGKDNGVFFFERAGLPHQEACII